MESEQILARVRKLLALAASPNAHEAAAAAARAQALIDEHRLQQWLSAEQAADTDPDPIADARDRPLEVGRRIRTWKVVLAVTLADANGCVAYTLARGLEDAIVLVGRQRDRAVVEALWAWLVQRIEWLSATHGAGQSRKWHDAFRVGVVDAVAERLHAQHDLQQAGLSAAALVVVGPRLAAHTAALERFVADHLRLGKGRGLRVDAQAWQQGREASDALVLPPGAPRRQR